MRLEPLPEDWDRALAVVAHPDDLEYGAASAVARWTQQGKQVVYVLVTRGETGIDRLPPDECARGAKRRSARARRWSVSPTSSSSVIPTARSSTGSRCATTSRVRFARTGPSSSSRSTTTTPGAAGALNMADHRNTGKAVLDAVRDAANPWVFTDTGDAWKGVRMVCESGSPEPTHAVDVTGTLDLGIASLREHRAYLAHVGTDPEFLRESAEGVGKLLGTQYATSFEVFDF